MTLLLGNSQSCWSHLESFNILQPRKGHTFMVCNRSWHVRGNHKLACHCSSTMTRDHFYLISYGTKFPLCDDVALNTYSFIHSIMDCPLSQATLAGEENCALRKLQSIDLPSFREDIMQGLRVKDYSESVSDLQNRYNGHPTSVLDKHAPEKKRFVVVGPQHRN